MLHLFHKWESLKISPGGVKRNVIARRRCSKCGKTQIKKRRTKGWLITHEKVYCKNCKNKKVWVLPLYGARRTTCEVKSDEISPFNNKIIVKGEWDEYFSENNKGDCKRYERKWWRFWA